MAAPTIPFWATGAAPAGAGINLQALLAQQPAAAGQQPAGLPAAAPAPNTPLLASAAQPGVSTAHPALLQPGPLPQPAAAWTNNPTALLAALRAAQPAAFAGVAGALPQGMNLQALLAQQASAAAGQQPAGIQAAAAVAPAVAASVPVLAAPIAVPLHAGASPAIAGQLAPMPPSLQAAVAPVAEQSRPADAGALTAGVAAAPVPAGVQLAVPAGAAPVAMPPPVAATAAGDAAPQLAATSAAGTAASVPGAGSAAATPPAQPAAAAASDSLGAANLHAAPAPAAVAKDPLLQRCGFAKLLGDNGLEYYIKKYDIVLGRKHKNHTLDVVLGESPVLSRHHARILYNFDAKRWELVVEGKNGVSVNGTLYTPQTGPAVLQSQDFIQAGDNNFYFLSPKQPRKRAAPKNRSSVQGSPEPTMPPALPHAQQQQQTLQQQQLQQAFQQPVQMPQQGLQLQQQPVGQQPYMAAVPGAATPSLQPFGSGPLLPGMGAPSLSDMSQGQLQQLQNHFGRTSVVGGISNGLGQSQPSAGLGDSQDLGGLAPMNAE